MHPRDWLQSRRTRGPLHRSDKTADRFKCATIDERGAFNLTGESLSLLIKASARMNGGEEKEDADCKD